MEGAFQNYGAGAWLRLLAGGVVEWLSQDSGLGAPQTGGQALDPAVMSGGWLGATPRLALWGVRVEVVPDELSCEGECLG